MLNTDHTQVWLADLEQIIAEIDTQGIPCPSKNIQRKQARKPLWEE